MQYFNSIRIVNICRFVFFVRFRPIRRDSDSAESQSSASLAGSAPDVDVIQVRLSRRPAVAPATGPAPCQRRLKPTYSSNGSASSYDNVDEPSTPSRHVRLQPWLPQPRSSRPVGTRVAGSGTDEALDEVGRRLTPGEPSTIDVGTGSTGVWRRPTLDGHLQVVPPTMIGVFDPTSQLSKFAAQTSARPASPVNFQRRCSNTAKVSETVSKEATSRLQVSLEQIGLNRVRSDRTFSAVTVHESPPPILTHNSQLLESDKATDSNRGSPGDEPAKVAAFKSPEICETVSEEAQPPAEHGEGTSTSSSSSSVDDDEEEEAERAEVDDEEAVVCAEIRSPGVDSEQLLTVSTPASGTRSDDSPDAAVDVGEQRSEQAATSDQQSARPSASTPSQDAIVTGGHVAYSPFPLPVPETSPSANGAISEVEVDQVDDVENEGLSSSTSSQSKSSCCSHDEQNDNFEKQPELMISTTARGILNLHWCI